MIPDDKEDSDGSGGYLYDSNSTQEESGEGGQGGKSGEIEFRYHDVLSAPKRDDLLPPGEIKRLLIVHQEVHKDRVVKQKIAREQRAALKEGRYVAPTAEQLRQGLSGGGGGVSPYKKHPISNMAQFSGVDKQVVGVPTLNEADTNPEMKDALENRLQNRLENRLSNRYTNTPTLKPR